MSNLKAMKFAMTMLTLCIVLTLILMFGIAAIARWMS